MGPGITIEISLYIVKTPLYIIAVKRRSVVPGCIVFPVPSLNICGRGTDAV
jgi:hypothetical protein